MRFFHRVLTLTTLTCVCLSASADDYRTPDPLFQSNEALDVTITAPLTTLIEERSKDEYLAGAFQFTDGDGDSVVLTSPFGPVAIFDTKPANFRQ